MGEGKMKELVINALNKGATLLVFDQELSPSQVKAIGELTELKAIDRSQLILDIFSRRAHSRDGKVQVELALTTVRDHALDAQGRADLAAELQAAISDVLVAKALAAMEQTGLERLVVAGGVGANRQLRAQLTAAAGRMGCTVYYPPLEFCTDNGAMIAFAGALRLQQGMRENGSGFTVRPRWDLASLAAA